MSAADRPPILLLHGWGGSFTSTWVANGWCDAISAMGRRVIAVDLPGHGRRGGSFEPEEYADLAGLLRWAIPEGAVIDAVGYSLGAKLVLELAARDLKQCRRIVLGGLGGNAFSPELLGDVVALALEQGVTKETPQPAKKLVEYALSAGNDARRLAAVLRRPPNPVITPARLSRLRCPTFVVAGDQDAIANPVKPLLEALPHALSRTLAGVDHLNLPTSREFREAALSFLH
jgi:pimeloyl-ACP methyl ester carboxylesterase